MENPESRRGSIPTEQHVVINNPAPNRHGADYWNCYDQLRWSWGIVPEDINRLNQEGVGADQERIYVGL